VSRVEAAEAYLAGYNHEGEGLTLRALRHRRNMTLRQVEVETGFNRGVLSQIERGLMVPSPVHLLALSDLYGVSPEDWQLHVEYRLRERRAAA
jgi:transcriptional regulator with XRE-family HTH domain